MAKGCSRLIRQMMVLVFGTVNVVTGRQQHVEELPVIG